MTSRAQTVVLPGLTLACGRRLNDVKQFVTIEGSPRADNVLLVLHALTGSGRPSDWWPAIAGPGGLFDPKDWCVVGINALGSCYGSTGPSEYAGPFAPISVADMVRAQACALERLGLRRFTFAIGGSLGGMQALTWALEYPERVDNAIVVGAHDHQSPMAIALNAIQRECIALDPVRGLRTARKLAMLTYKSEALFNARHGRRRDRHGLERFDIEGYLEAQADAFAGRMDAATYATLTGAMDSFDVRDRVATGVVRANLHFVGISSDWLFRAADVRAAHDRFARHGFRTTYRELGSDHGHDAFLAEASRLAALLSPLVDPRRAAGSVTPERGALSTLVETSAHGRGDEFVFDRMQPRGDVFG